jgi:hypothetical protein
MNPGVHGKNAVAPPTQAKGRRSRKLLHDKLRRPPVRVRRPVRPHVGTDQAARGTHHARAQRSQSHIVRQPIGIHDGAVIAPARAAVNEKIAAAVAADVFKRDGLECLGLPPRHDANKSGCAARSGSIGTGSINVTSSASARELFTRFDTGKRCSTSSAAGLSNSVPADPVSRAQVFGNYRRNSSSFSALRWAAILTFGFSELSNA